MKIQHVALKTNDLEKTSTFYKDVLGCSGGYVAEVGRVRLDFTDSFTLIFDRTDEPLHPSAQYLGLELEDFGAVDRLYQKVAAHVAVGRDMRELYREVRGPYGFFIEDPNGYPISVQIQQLNLPAEERRLAERLYPEVAKTYPVAVVLQHDRAC